MARTQEEIDFLVRELGPPCCDGKSGGNINMLHWARDTEGALWAAVTQSGRLMLLDDKHGMCPFDGTMEEFVLKAKALFLAREMKKSK